MKKMLVALAVMAMGASLLAEDGMEYCIWWQVNETYHNTPVGATFRNDWGFDSARLVATIDDTPDHNITLGWHDAETKVNTFEAMPASLADMSAPIQSIFVEFYTLSGETLTMLGYSDPTAWAAVASAVDDFRGKGSSGGTLAHSTVYSPTGYNAVPEPTGGMLVLFGLAGLALRRKRDV